MSANRSNIDWHLVNMIGGRDLVPKLGEKGYAPGAIAIKSTGTFGNGIYINHGTFDSCNFVSTDGLSAILDGGAEQDQDEISTTQNYLAGSRTVLYNTGIQRVFRYAKATNIVTNIRQGIKFYGMQSDGAGYAAATAGAIGDTTMTIDAGSSGDHTANEFRGGILVIHTHTDAKHQFFGITGNTASDVDGNITFYLDGKLTHTITSSHGVEVWPNPYVSVRDVGGGHEHSSVAGIPNRHTVAANTWLWLQTWGPVWSNPIGTSTYAMVAGERRLVFDYAGNVCPVTDARGAWDDGDYQHAGYILDRTATGTGAGSYMLEVAP